MSSRDGFWRSVLLDRRPGSLPQALLRIAILAAVLIPLTWVIGGDLNEALRYCAIFIAVWFTFDLVLLWNSHE